MIRKTDKWTMELYFTRMAVNRIRTCASEDFKAGEERVLSDDSHMQAHYDDEIHNLKKAIKEEK